MSRETTILIIDDDAELRQALVEQFDLEESFAAVGASSAAEGFAAAAEHKPAAIVLDVSLPDMDGFAACKGLRDQGVKAPIIMLTGAAQEEEQQVQGLDAGANDYVLKPFKFSVLLAVATDPFLNLAPTWIYVIFWLGVPALSVLFGNVWRALSPWRAIADGAVWAWELTGRRARPLSGYPEQFGRWPAAVAWLRQQHAQGALLCSVCTGSLMLAEAGLLDGEEATCHWATADLIRRRYPAPCSTCPRGCARGGEGHCGQGGQSPF